MFLPLTTFMQMRSFTVSYLFICIERGYPLDWAVFGPKTDQTGKLKWILCTWYPRVDQVFKKLLGIYSNYLISFSYIRVNTPNKFHPNPNPKYHGENFSFINLGNPLYFSAYFELTWWTPTFARIWMKSFWGVHFNIGEWYTIVAVNPQ